MNFLHAPTFLATALVTTSVRHFVDYCEIAIVATTSQRFRTYPRHYEGEQLLANQMTLPIRVVFGILKTHGRVREINLHPLAIIKI
jgi:hypothetical protein